MNEKTLTEINEVIDRLEAWRDTADGLMRSTGGTESRDNFNLRNNYQDLINKLCNAKRIDRIETEASAHHALTGE